MSDAVVVRGLSKAYGDVHAVRDVSFAVQRGETFGLLGPNGAGKTTTLECLLGLRDPDNGDIEIAGIDARRSLNQVKARIGAALQATALQERITPREALRLFAAFYPNPAEPSVLLKRFGLETKADAYFETLSGGQRQRLALAVAFVNNPEVVVLDEPTAGLDVHARRELHELLAHIRQDGQTVLLSTHDLQEAERLCDRVAIIDRGRVVAIDSPRALVTATGKSTLEDVVLQLTEGGL